MVLSPAEALGLAGASFDGRVRRALHHLSNAEQVKLDARLRADAEANGVTYERDGTQEPVRIMARPLLVMPDQLAYVHRVCTRLTDALKRLPELYLNDADVRRALAIRDDEAAWLRALWRPSHRDANPVYGRLDAVCDFTSASWQQSLAFMEPNLSGVGGIHFAPVAEALVMRDVVPTILERDPDLRIELPRDQRELFLQVVLDHARSLGREGSAIALVDPKYERGGPDEQPALLRHLREQCGATIVHADPRELRVEGDEVYFESTCIDVAYRDYETRELLDLEREHGRPLSAIRLLFAQNRVVSSLVGDFDHKSCWELLTDDELAQKHWSIEARRIFRKHVLWTRVLRERNTSLPAGTGDLLPFVRDHREDLVIKPNRGYGGAGVHVGSSTSQSEWERLIDAAVRTADDPQQSWVVQAATRLPVYEFPTADEHGSVQDEPFYAVMGFAATDDGVGILCRVSQKQVVNVALRGGLAAVLVGHPPRELRAQRPSQQSGERATASLRAQIRELRHLDQALGLLGWDEETYLPTGAREGRGDQVATLEGLRHGILTSERLGELIDDVAAAHGNDATWQAELTRLKRLRHDATALPDTLVRAFAQARSASLAAWERARASDDFALFAPAFTQLLALARERATLLARGGDPYDAVLDEHEPGMTRARIDPVFSALRDRLTAVIPRYRDATSRYKGALDGRRFEDAAQWAFCQDLLRKMGFSFERGRVDRSTHPFSLSIGGHDTRLTLRVFEDNLPSAIFSALHEAGHGLYEQGFATHDHDTLLADAPGMGMHESQSRLWENLVGRSRPFWRAFFPALQRCFPAQLADFDAERFYRAVNVVEPILNRVDSDEVTYNLHILLRYELEVALLSGELSVSDLPAAWNARCEAMFGMRPASALQGCLQDVHWSLGSFGYFPTYTLGNLYAAQLAEHYASQHDLDAQLASGDLLSLRNWLQVNVHSVGHRLPAEDLMKKLTGRGLDAEPFFRALARKFE